MPFASLPDIELYYESHGEGPVVTFLHGAGGNHISWWQQVPHFSRKYRCLTIDHRGFGRSVDVERRGSTRYVEDLLGLLDQLEVERTALVAQSMGGLAALGLAVRHPERVTALVMADNWGWFDDGDIRARWSTLRADRTEDPPAPGGMARRYKSDNPRGVFLYQQIASLNPPRPADVPFLEGNGVTRQDLGRLTMPILWLVGAEDSTVPPEIVRLMHDFTPRSEYAEIPGCGHSAYFEDAPAFNRTVGDFLERHLS